MVQVHLCSQLWPVHTGHPGAPGPLIPRRERVRQCRVGRRRGLAAEQDRQTSCFIRSRVLEVAGCELSVTPFCTIGTFLFIMRIEALCYFYK